MTVRLYRAWNGPAPTTASQAAITTSTAIKTMLQVSTPAGFDITIMAWGFSMDGATAAAGVQWELIDTDTVAATGLTAHTTSTVHRINNPTGPATGVTMGTGNTGYSTTAPTEGTITTTRVLDSAFVQPTGAYVHRWPLGQEPIIGVSKFVRIRVKAAAAVNALCWIDWSE
jgi:hypothetical protein